MKKVCVITDNRFIYDSFLKIIKDTKYNDYQFEFYCSLIGKTSPLFNTIEAIRLKDLGEDFFSQYELFISLHCKQLFPEQLVNNHRCINVHPGMNPYNRGWYPQVFSIINKLPVGVTIHEMDVDLDHGAIIAQAEVPVYSWSTSYSVYTDIQNKEIEMVSALLPSLLVGDYVKINPKEEGNINYFKDFNGLCELKLNEMTTWGDAIDRLRALSFNGYKNAFFIDKDGNKIWLDISLEKEV